MRHAFGAFEKIAGRNLEELGIATIHGEAKALPFGAKVEMPGAAMMASTATNAEVDGDVVAFRELAHRFTDLHDDACRLMAADELVRVPPRDHRVAVIKAQIAAANAGGLDLDQDLVRADLGDRHGANFDLLVSWQEDGGHFGHFGSPSLEGVT